MKRMTLTFAKDEFDALAIVAKTEHREIRQQAAFLVRQQLKQLNFLSPSPDISNESEQIPILNEQLNIMIKRLSEIDKRLTQMEIYHDVKLTIEE